MEVITRAEVEPEVITLEACTYDGSHGRGYLFVEDHTSLLRRHVWVTWMAGLWHHIEEVQDPSFSPGRALALIPEPDDPLDAHAIAIWNAERTKTAGYLPHATVEKLTPAHRVGLAVVERIDTGGRRTGLLVAVSRVPLRLELVELDPVAMEYRAHRLPSMPDPPTMCDAPDAMEAMWEMARALSRSSSGGAARGSQRASEPRPPVTRERTKSWSTLRLR